MIDGAWVDPWTMNLRAFRDTWSRETFWRQALDDYTDGMSTLPGISEISPLSVGEAWIGVPGQINAVNLKTSMGPPYFQRKKLFVEMDHEAHEVFVRDDVQMHIDHILAVLDSGRVYVPTCAHSLKDEPISVEKAAKCKTRVFNTMSAAFNVLLKQYFAPLARFMQQHWRFFEAFVGMDINSWDCDALVEYLCSLYERAYRDDQFLRQLKAFGDGDFEGFDTKLASIVRQFEAQVWRKFLSYTRYSPRDRQRAYLLCLGTIFTMRFIKNDIFLVCFGNPSGSNITILSNGVGNSLLFRFCYYREADALGILPPPFRARVKLMTLGDDNIFSVHVRAPWFNYDVLTRRMLEAGCVYTAADKTSKNIQLKTLFECSFLKRSFERSGKRWIARIELKSIVKMLVFLKDSELGQRDHCAVLVSNALRELYFHGPAVFEEWRQLLDLCVHDLDLAASPLLHFFSYHELEERFRGDDYPGWMVSDRGELLKVQTGF